MVIKGIGSRNPAIAGFTLGGGHTGGGLAGIFREVEVRDHRVDVAFAEIGELGSECGVICTVEGGGKLGFELREIGFNKIFGGGQSCAGILVFQEIQVGIIVGSGFGLRATIRKTVTALLQSHGSGLRTACRMLAGGLARKVVGAILRR